MGDAALTAQDRERLSAWADRHNTSPPRIKPDEVARAYRYLTGGET